MSASLFQRRHLVSHGCEAGNYQIVWLDVVTESMDCGCPTDEAELRGGDFRFAHELVGTETAPLTAHMLGFFERQRLVKKGLAPQKTRRRVTESELLDTLEHGAFAKFAVLGCFAVGLVWIVQAGTQVLPKDAILVALLIFGVAAAHLRINHGATFRRNSRLLLLLLILFAHLGLVKYCLVSGDAVAGLTGGGLSASERRDLWHLAIPFSFAPLLVGVLLGRPSGVFAAVFTTLLTLPVLASVSDDLYMIVTNTTTHLVAGFVAIFLTADVRKRGDLPRAGLFVGLTTWVLAVAFKKLNLLHIWQATEVLNLQVLGWQSAVAIGGPLVMTLIIVGALPFIESAFGIVTSVRWLELADLNHPLLKRMTIEAPGTFQHSLAVANLAESACEAIGANATMARVCSYFHDIGKLVKPEYFTENMRHDRNPHDELAPTMSALIIIAHVKEGVSLGLEYKLNPDIIDVIQQHHGTSLVYYFYNKAIEQQAEARTEGKIASMHDEDLPGVSESSFRYGGPRPKTRETAVISLADSIESAARSLEKPTLHRIEQLITDIIGKRIAEGQLDDCDLKFNELETIAESFRHTLSSMLHSRVAYPDERDTKTRKQESGAGQRSMKSRSDASAA